MSPRHVRSAGNVVASSSSSSSSSPLMAERRNHMALGRMQSRSEAKASPSPSFGRAKRNIGARHTQMSPLASKPTRFSSSASQPRSPRSHGRIIRGENGCSRTTVGRSPRRNRPMPVGRPNGASASSSSTFPDPAATSSLPANHAAAAAAVAAIAESSLLPSSPSSNSPSLTKTQVRSHKKKKLRPPTSPRAMRFATDVKTPGDV